MYVKERARSVDWRTMMYLRFFIIVELYTDMSLHFLTISSSPVRPYFLQPHDSGSHSAKIDLSINLDDYDTTISV
jgi:hypothetical protein